MSEVGTHACLLLFLAFIGISSLLWSWNALQMETMHIRAKEHKDEDISIHIEMPKRSEAIGIVNVSAVQNDDVAVIQDPTTMSQASTVETSTQVLKSSKTQTQDTDDTTRQASNVSHGSFTETTKPSLEEPEGIINVNGTNDLEQETRTEAIIFSENDDALASTHSQGVQDAQLGNQVGETPNATIPVKPALREKFHSCGALKIPSRPDAEDSWQATATDNASFVYSAHRDPRSDVTLLVHVTGIMLTQQLYNATGGRLFCQLWDPHSGMTAVSEGRTSRIAARKRYKYENSMTLCEFASSVYIPGRTFLSVVTEPCGPPQNSLRIHDNVHSPRPLVNHTVCICGSMRNNYSDYQRFIEWMELNAILGVQRTIIYDTDSAEHMQQVFQYYAQKGVLDNIVWEPPNVYVRKHAHLAMVHDCLMRSMLKTKYTAFIDVDETIAPRKPGVFTWDEMFETAGCSGKSYIAAPNVLFHPDWQSDELYAKDKEVAETWRLYTLLKTKREKNFMEFQMRSKNIVRPENVEHLKLHGVFLRKGVEEEPCFLDHHIGALHHYRWLYHRIQTGYSQEPEWTVDRTLHKYKDELTSRVAGVYADLEGVVPTS